MNRYLLFFILFFLNISLFSQEVLIDCNNPFLMQYSKKYFEDNNIKSAKSSDTLELPFFDDFANSYVYPDSFRWVDKFAFINNAYPINPVSVGVATLDALNEFGYLYPHLSSSNSSIADYLTSQPINLAYPPADSIYLSFFYQPGGNGNNPEFADSLVLQFRTPDTEWESVWNVGGGVDSVTSIFQLVMVPIKEEKFLKKGFQFRFLNYASISSNQELSWKSNADMWNLDYIKLDKDRSHRDTLMNDVAFIYDFKSILKDYESVPWKHFVKGNGNEYIVDSVWYIYRNMWDFTFNIDRIFYIIDDYTSQTICLMTPGGDSENINPLSVLEYDKDIQCDLDSEKLDSASFVITGIIDTRITDDKDLYGWNDTIRYYQNFYDYYAYDDGTSEVGYGVIGSQASVAYKFEPLITDTLQGVYIYFNHTLNNANHKYFYLTVWDDDGGYPGKELKSIEGVIPVHTRLNKFIFYPLDEPMLIESTFYIGWVKTTNDVLNCGFDRNRNSKDKLFYNVTGSWEKSQFDGALMVRPVFGADPPLIDVADNKIIASSSDFEIYPNPANDILNITSDYKFDYLEIFDTNGKLLIKTGNSQNINISSLNSGIYYIQLKSNSRVFKTKKFVVL